jgi:hypothetical protein
MTVLATLTASLVAGRRACFPRLSEPCKNEQWRLQVALLEDSRCGIDRSQPPSRELSAAARSREFAVPMRTASHLFLGEMKIELGGAYRAFYPHLIGSAN